MNVLVTGSSGFIGSALSARLQAEGHEVVRLVRREPAPGSGEARWDPESGYVDAGALEGIDGVVHLAGENIANRRWNEEQKARIRNSRTRGTALLANALAQTSPPPRCFVSASAVGYYGDRGAEPLGENEPPGTDFIAQATAEWEAAAQPAADAGMRVAIMRLGMTLDPVGGPLKRIVRPFRLGLGGRLGSGRQYMSWLSLEDAVRSFVHTLTADTLSGPVNVAAPQAITNAEFTRALATALGRPALFAAPRLALRVALGEMADVLLFGANISPARLVESGFTFRHTEIEATLREMLGG